MSELINAHLEGESFFWEGGPIGILLLHGLTATTAEVLPLARRLHELGYTIAAPLLPGHGTTPDDLNKVRWSDWLWTAEMSYHHLATTCEHVFVGGESTGAVIALHLASKHADIAGVLAYAPAIKLAMPTPDLLKLYAAAPFIDAVPKEGGNENALWQGYAVNPLQGIIELLRMGREARSRLQLISQPVLIMQGRHDSRIDLSSGDIIYDGIQSTLKQFHWLENSGHIIILEDELDEITEKTVEFIQQALAAQTPTAELKPPFTKPALKQLLREISQNDFALPHHLDLFETAQAMMQHIGTTDSQLRDDLIYTTFYMWILEKKLFQPGQLRHLLTLALDRDHIFYGLGEQDTDTIFTRSFSVLLLPLILIAHRHQPFLTEQEVQTVKQKVLAYLQGEQDLRGYTGQKGWAHGIAHAADALDDLVQCQEMAADDLQEILMAVGAVACTAQRPYIHEEDERLVTAVCALLQRQLVPQAAVVAWIERFQTWGQPEKPAPDNYQGFNARNFLRSLYFRLHHQDQSPTLCQTIQETLRQLSRFA